MEHERLVWVLQLRLEEPEQFSVQDCDDDGWLLEEQLRVHDRLLLGAPPEQLCVQDREVLGRLPLEQFSVQDRELLGRVPLEQPRLQDWLALGRLVLEQLAVHERLAAGRPPPQRPSATLAPSEFLRQLTERLWLPVVLTHVTDRL